MAGPVASARAALAFNHAEQLGALRSRCNTDRSARSQIVLDMHSLGRGCTEVFSKHSPSSGTPSARAFRPLARHTRRAAAMSAAPAEPITCGRRAGAAETHQETGPGQPGTLARPAALFTLSSASAAGHRGPWCPPRRRLTALTPTPHSTPAPAHAEPARAAMNAVYQASARSRIASTACC